MMKVLARITLILFFPTIAWGAVCGQKPSAGKDTITFRGSTQFNQIPRDSVTDLYMYNSKPYTGTIKYDRYWQKPMTVHFCRCEDGHMGTTFNTYNEGVWVKSFKSKTHCPDQCPSEEIEITYHDTSSKSFTSISYYDYKRDLKQSLQNKVNNRYHGEQRAWFEDGTLKHLAHYDKGHLTDDTRWHNNGQIKRKYENNGRGTITVTIWDENGNIIEPKEEE